MHCGGRFDPAQLPEFVTDEALFFFRLFGRLNTWKGSLPDPGGILDQDERTMQALDIIASEVAAHERMEAELQRQRAEIASAASAGARVYSYQRRR